MKREIHRLDIPLQTRLAPIGTVDAKARTADLVWSTGARVKRYDWMRDTVYMEELSMDPAHVRLGRLQTCDDAVRTFYVSDSISACKHHIGALRCPYCA